MDVARRAVAGSRPARALPALVLTCWLATLGAASAAAARSPAVDLVCMGSAQLDFTPPLNFTTSVAKAAGLVSSCASPSGRYRTIKSGVLFATNPLVATGCSPAPLTIAGHGSTVFWNDGTQSTFDVAIGTDPTSDALGVNATFRAGPLAGDQASFAPAVVSQRGLCLLGGVRSLTLGFGALVWTDPGSSRRSASKAGRGAGRKRGNRLSPRR